MHKVRHQSIANNPRSNLAHQFCMEKVAFPVAQDMVHSLFYDQVQDIDVRLASFISALRFFTGFHFQGTSLLF